MLVSCGAAGNARRPLGERDRALLSPHRPVPALRCKGRLASRQLALGLWCGPEDETGRTPLRAAAVVKQLGGRTDSFPSSTSRSSPSTICFTRGSQLARHDKLVRSVSCRAVASMSRWRAPSVWTRANNPLLSELICVLRCEFCSHPGPKVQGGPDVAVRASSTEVHRVPTQLKKGENKAASRNHVSALLHAVSRIAAHPNLTGGRSGAYLARAQWVSGQDTGAATQPSNLRASRDGSNPPGSGLAGRREPVDLATTPSWLQPAALRARLRTHGLRSPGVVIRAKSGALARPVRRFATYRRGDWSGPPLRRWARPHAINPEITTQCCSRSPGAL